MESSAKIYLFDKRYRMIINFFDTETTWFVNPKTNIIQIWMIIEDTETWEIIEIDELFKPNEPIPPKLTEIHWINDDMVKDKPLFIEKLWLYLKLLRECNYIVCHNTDFDLWMIQVELNKSNIEERHKNKYIEIFEEKSICTMKSWRKTINDKYPKLWDIFFEKFWENFDNAHNAMCDVRATKKVFWKLVEEWKIILK